MSSAPSNVPPGLHELESELMKLVWERGECNVRSVLEARAAAEVGALVDIYGEAALVHFARQMDQLDPERREQLRRLAHRDH